MITNGLSLSIIFAFKNIRGIIVNYGVSENGETGSLIRYEGHGKVMEGGGYWRISDLFGGFLGWLNGI